MSAVMTYNSLVEKLKSYPERTDTSYVSVIPTIVSLAEHRIAREAKVLGLQQYVTSAFSAGNGVYLGNGVIKKPARWRETIYFNVGTSTAASADRKPLFLRTYDFCRSYWPSSTTDKPLYYADYGFDHILVTPTPDASYPFELAYYELPQPLDEANQTNWLTENAPDLLLYACLLEAIPYLKDAERQQVWQAAYDRALSALGGEEASRAVDNAAKAKG